MRVFLFTPAFCQDSLVAPKDEFAPHSVFSTLLVCGRQHGSLGTPSYHFCTPLYTPGPVSSISASGSLPIL
ncbi:hypothetical protein XENTR_v10005202 [Xenopus tropicalis]|nr:hypothetical protein XENTR_v10005202 [Xenopus tropicalis]